MEENEALLQSLLEATRRLLDADAAAVLLLENGDKLVLRAGGSAEDPEGNGVTSLYPSYSLAATPQLQNVVREGHLLQVEDTQTLAHWVPLSSAAYRSWVAVPTGVPDGPRGVLALGWRAPREQDDDVLSAVTAAAKQVSVCLGTIRVQRELRACRRDLHQRTLQLITAENEERMRLAERLHDEPGQLLTVLKLGLSLMDDDVPAEAVTLHDQLSEAKDLTDEIMDRLRSIARGLRSSAAEPRP